MKKILAVLMISAFLLPGVNAQKTDNKRPASIGFSFILNDYTTASRIRNSSVSAVIRDKQWGKFSDGFPGVAVTYFQGMHNNIDLAVSLSGSYAKIAIPSRPKFEGDQFLLEADASAHFKMFPESFTVIPYLSGGIGASLYDGQLGAIVPLGLGLRFNIFEESSIFINTQYRVPLITEANGYHFFHSIGISGLLNKKDAEVKPAP
jgi:OmpA-OmpF porin, OOP family